MKKLPKKVLVLGETYFVKRIKNLTEKENIEGYVEAHKYTIGIDSSLKGKYMWRVFYHELGHAFCYESGLHEILSGQALELFCQGFSGLILSLKGR